MECAPRMGCFAVRARKRCAWLFTWADIGADAVRPYNFISNDPDNAVNVIWLNNKFILEQTDLFADFGGTEPFGLNNYSKGR